MSEITCGTQEKYPVKLCRNSLNVTIRKHLKRKVEAFQVIYDL
jgi:hypothetical protein